LGFAEDKELLELAYNRVKEEKYHSAKSAILVNGYSKIHKEFEDNLIKHNKFDDAIVVGSGFLANISLFESLARRGDEIFMDSQFHASGIVSLKLSSGKTTIFEHNSYMGLEKLIKSSTAKRKIVAIEGIYSMSGDLAKKEIFEIADKYGAILVVDEAHSSGVIGDNLLGIFDFYNMTPKQNHIKMGTLGKAYGSYGAYILASCEIISFLQNRAKPIIYSTAPSLFDIAFANVAFEKILSNLTFFKGGLASNRLLMKQYFDIEKESLIYDIATNSNALATKYKNSILDKGYIIGAIRQPTVTAPIIRIIPHLWRTKEDIIGLSETIKYVINDQKTSFI
jgi:8-amino-7-oxononanoate synthase